jgi:hypothetical protein
MKSPPPAALQVLERGPGGVERALEVHVDHQLDLLGIELEERAVGPDAGVGDDDVQAPERLDGVRDGGSDLLEVAHVARARDGALEAEIVAAARRQPDRRSGGRQPAGDRRADAPAGAGDERDLAFELAHRTPIRTSTSSWSRRSLP